MKTIGRCGLAVVLAALAAAPAWAGTDARVGTGGAIELKLPVGARSLALGGATLANERGVEALFFNPAGAAATESNTEVAFSHTEYIADINLNYFGLTHGFGGWGTLGLSAKVLSIGDIQRTSETSPDGTGETFSPTFATLGATYSRRMTDRVNFGVTTYYISEKILQESATGVAFDFGFQYDAGYRGLALGLALKNLGPSMAFNGTDFEQNIFRPEDDPTAARRTVTNSTAGFELPTFIQFGASYPLVNQAQNRAVLYGAFQNNSFSRDEYKGGLEWTYRNDYALRVGYAGSGKDNELFGLNYGLGVRVPFGSNHMIVDYAGQRVSNFFSDVHHVSLRMTF
ncbi:MAG TPA: PorV/PorQ family protein [Candidatus Eisenbacteria bacterium]|nr:PorV/PorQ family protein [Candidatus Eisenbacteria bacterium]